MVRVNLLPNKRELRRAAGEGSQLWLVAIGVAVLVEIVGLLFFHQSKLSELNKLLSDNRKIQTSIDEIKRQIADHATIKTQLKELRDREEALVKLQAARTGPTATLFEVSRVLTPHRGPTTDRDKLEQLKRDNPSAVPNANWDPRRLWLTSFTEKDRKVKLLGLARDAEDVSEFLRRLTLSDFFYDVKLLPAIRVADGTTKLMLVKFEFSAKVRY